MNIGILILVVLLVAVIVTILICKSKAVPVPKYTVELYEIFNNNQTLIIMSVEITLSQKKRLKVVPKDAQGNETKVAAGSSKWSISDETKANLQPVEGNDLEVDLIPVGVGVAEINWEGNGNNDGVGEDIPLSAFAALEVTAGDATQVVIEAGPAEQL